MNSHSHLIIRRSVRPSAVLFLRSTFVEHRLPKYDHNDDDGGGGGNNFGDSDTHHRSAVDRRRNQTGLNVAVVFCTEHRRTFVVVQSHIFVFGKLRAIVDRTSKISFTSDLRSFRSFFFVSNSSLRS